MGRSAFQAILLFGTAHLAITLLDLHMSLRIHVLQIAVSGLIGQAGALGDGLNGQEFLAALHLALNQFQSGAADSLCRGGASALLGMDIFLELAVAVQQTDVQADAADDVGGLDGLQCEVAGACIPLIWGR